MTQSEAGHGFAESFDKFLEASAEAALTHVVSAAKGILQTLTIHVVGYRGLEYNDEYHYFDGDSGIVPQRFFLSAEDAKADVDKANRHDYRDGEWKDHSVFEIGGFDYNDDLQSYLRDEMRVPSDQMWNVTFRDYFVHCEANGNDPMRLLEPLWTTYEVSPA